MLDISIIIVNYLSLQDTMFCIESIRTCELKDLSYEIIVVNNDSKKIVKETLNDKFPGVHVIQNKKNEGIGKANNIGASAAKGTFLLILNPDIIVKKGSLYKLYHHINNDTTIGVIAPRLVYKNGKINNSVYRLPGIFIPLWRRSFFLKKLFKKELDRYLMKDCDLSQIQRVDWLLGACLMIRREIFNNLGGFDEQFFMYFEDVDLCRRVSSFDLKVIYYPLVEFIHDHKRESTKKILGIIPFNKLTFFHIISWIKYLQKWSKTEN